MGLPGTFCLVYSYLRPCARWAGTQLRYFHFYCFFLTMSKYNMFLGKARGSVGDVVFSVLNGQQVARSRNRSPRNPNSNAQRIQRAVMASVLQAYSAGKQIFDHSFEGRAVGLENMRRFLSLNVRALRAAVVADLAAGNTGAACAGRVTGPGVASFVPWTFKVSEGTLSQNAFDSALRAPDSVVLSDWIAQNNLRKDDIFTLVVFQCLSPDTSSNTLFVAPGATDYYGKVGKSHFSYLQLKVKDLSQLSEQTLDLDTDEISYNTLFDVVAMDGIAFDDTINLISGVLSGDTLPLEGSYFSSGVIRSRESSGQRSDCTLEYPANIQGWAAEWGLTSDYIIAAWDKAAAAAQVDPSLILEGSNFSQGAAATPREPVTFDSCQVTTSSGFSAWPTEEGIQKSGAPRALRFKVFISDVDYWPIVPGQVAGIELYIKNNGDADFHKEGTLSHLDSEDDWYYINYTVPSEVIQTNCKLMVNGVQYGAVFTYIQFAD